MRMLQPACPSPPGCPFLTGVELSISPRLPSCAFCLLGLAGPALPTTWTAEDAGFGLFLPCRCLAFIPPATNLHVCHDAAFALRDLRWFKTSTKTRNGTPLFSAHTHVSVPACTEGFCLCSADRPGSLYSRTWEKLLFHVCSLIWKEERGEEEVAWFVRRTGCGSRMISSPPRSAARLWLPAASGFVCAAAGCYLHCVQPHSIGIHGSCCHHRRGWRHIFIHSDKRLSPESALVWFFRFLLKHRDAALCCSF